MNVTQEILRGLGHSAWYDRRAAWAENHREQGLCTRCNNARDPFSKNLCRPCMIRQRDVMRARYIPKAKKRCKPDNEQFERICKVYIPLSIPLRFPRFFYKHIKPISSGCWEWTGTIVADPKYPWKRYGSYTLNGENKSKLTTTAHRISYAAFNGPLIKGWHIDHLCENKLCVNPAHLEQVTVSENKLRSTRRKEARGEPAYVWRTR